MKLWKSACAVAFAAGLTCTAHAASFAVNGVMTGVDAIIPENPIAPGVYLDSIAIAFNPANPAFTGLWNIDVSNFTLSGVADFESYQANTHFWLRFPASGGGETVFDYGSYTVTRPHDVQTIDGSGATYQYDAATRTLTMTQPVITLTGTSENCVSEGTIGCPIMGDYVPESVNDIVFQLIFAEDMRSFTGTSTITRHFPDGSGDNTHWSFSGTAVPVPAAAWLFGSSVLGLAGFARRKTERRERAA